jgi:hypothetical protein
MQPAKNHYYTDLCFDSALIPQTRFHVIRKGTPGVNIFFHRLSGSPRQISSCTACGFFLFMLSPSEAVDKKRAKGGYGLRFGASHARKIK